MTEEELRRSFAENLGRLLDARGLRQTDVATYLGVSRPTVSEWLSGKKMPRIAKIEALAAWLRVPKSVLLEKTDDEAKREPVPADPILSLVQRINDRLETATQEELETVYRIVLAVLGEEDK